MKKSALVLTAALVLAGLSVTPGVAQDMTQTAALVRVEPGKLANGNRASKILGGVVLNEANETVGKVDDLLIGADGRTPYAVLSVGGFLGLGDRLVAVPFDSLKMSASKIILPGATKEALKGMPEFKFAGG